MGLTRIALVTDSTWSLPPELAEEMGIRVLPLHVNAGRTALVDRAEDMDRILRLLRTTALTTSQPTPGEVRDLLHSLADGGAEGIVCVHLSDRLSGTVASVRGVAEEVAADRHLPIEVVDTRTVAGALGYAVAVAGASLAAGDPMATAVARARECATSSRVFLSVADLGHLQRGGRLRGPQLVLGTALGIKPVLTVRDGEIRLLESVRGTARAHQRLVALALRAAWSGSARDPRRRISVAVHHVDARQAAERVAARVAEEAVTAGVEIDRLDVTPMAGVLAVHAGPEALAVAMARTGGLIHS